jgi:hypothetical protein
VARSVVCAGIDEAVDLHEVGLLLARLRLGARIGVRVIGSALIATPASGSTAARRIHEPVIPDLILLLSPG